MWLFTASGQWTLNAGRCGRVRHAEKGTKNTKNAGDAWKGMEMTNGTCGILSMIIKALKQIESDLLVNVTF